jgi:hypothetical protein
MSGKVEQPSHPVTEPYQVSFVREHAEVDLRVNLRISRSEE